MNYYPNSIRFGLLFLPKMTVNAEIVSHYAIYDLYFLSGTSDRGDPSGSFNGTCFALSVWEQRKFGCLVQTYTECLDSQFLVGSSPMSGKSNDSVIVCLDDCDRTQLD